MKNYLKILVFSILAVFLVAGNASAIPMLSLDDGAGNSVTIIDNGSGDSSNEVGAVTYYGSLGNWFINVTTGITAPVIGSLDYPEMHLNNVSVSSSTGGTLTILFQETGFTMSDDLEGFIFDGGGTTDGEITLSSYYDDTNEYNFIDKKLISTLDTFTGGAFSGTETALLNPSDPFGIQIVATITHAGGVKSSSFDADLNPVPEPATMLLLGSGLIGLVGIGRKKFLKKG